MFVITYLSLFSLEGAPKITIPNFDKIVHLGFHAIHTFLWICLLKSAQKITFRKVIIYAVLVDVLFGVLIEILQALGNNNRHADVMDVLANILGTVVAVIFYRNVIKRFNSLKTII